MHRTLIHALSTSPHCPYFAANQTWIQISVLPRSVFVSFASRGYIWLGWRFQGGRCGDQLESQCGPGYLQVEPCEELELDSEGMVPTRCHPLLPSVLHDAASDFQAHSVSGIWPSCSSPAAVQNYRAGARSSILLTVTSSLSGVATKLPFHGRPAVA